MKKFFLIFLFIFFSHFYTASALEITEVMYDVEGTDTDREWIEIYNNEDVAVDVSTHKLFEANTNHSLEVVQGDKNLQIGGYAVIVQNKDKFKTDWPNFTGPIFDSSFSLSNDGEVISIKDKDLNIISELNYNSGMGASGDGKSLQKINGVWQGAMPTLGKTNTEITGNQNVDPIAPDTTKEIASGNSTTVSKEQKIVTKIIMSNFGFAKNSLEIKAETRNAEDEKVFYGKYFFNFGDGYSEEYRVSSFDKITHLYKYSGEYFVYLSYYANSYDTVPVATDKLLVKILDVGVFISNVGDEKDFFVEIKNNTNYESDISGWYISSFDKKFIFPKNSFLQANSKMILAPEITSFVFNDRENLKLYNSSENLIFDYGSLLKIKNKNLVVSVKSSAKDSVQIKNNLNNLPEDPKKTEFLDLNSINNKNLEANAINVLDKDVEKDNFWIYIFGLSFLIIIATFLVLFLRKKDKKIIEGDDFEILE